MAPESLVDKLLNVWVFAFIGILAWLYFKKESGCNESESEESDRDR